MAHVLLFILPALGLLGLAGLVFYLGLRSTKKKLQPEIEWRELELLEAEFEAIMPHEKFHPRSKM